MKTVIELWIQEGLEKGIQQGIQQGLRKGRQEGLREGLIKEARNLIFTYIESKIGNVPMWFKDKIESLDDIDKLHQIFKEMIKVEDLDKFLKDNFS